MSRQPRYRGRLTTLGRGRQEKLAAIALAATLKGGWIASFNQEEHAGQVAVCGDGFRQWRRRLGHPRDTVPDPLL